MSAELEALSGNPQWYKDAILYEIHVRSFADGNADGIGDFVGLTEKLDYLRRLGITALWLLPFYPSPLKDDGYDIADYFSIHPSYGTLSQFKTFLHEAHNRGIRVITELVINHTSDQHAWFRRSRRAEPGSIWRDFYVWSDTPERYKEARIIFKDFEASNWSWDSTAKAYYWHRFYSHQPDLNFDNQQVQRALIKVLDFWLDLGVDGLRLDAVPYLFEREGTNCENLPETYAFLEKLREHVDRNYQDRMLLAEANQWPEDAVAYFGNGNRCHMAFHFPVMPRLFMASWMEDRFPIIDIMEQTPEIPGHCQWALFLRNHDELTLEMVSDEERDYMYRVYAKDPSARINLGIRRRLAPLLGNNRRKIELLNVLLFSLPGTPVLYYGDELCMGDNHYLGDRNGVRTPMQWSADRNAGFSRANPQKLFLPVIIDPDYHYEAVNVDNQERNESSMLWWMRRLIATRKKFKALGRGSLAFVQSNNAHVISFLREYGEEVILIVANLSRLAQAVSLDLSKYAGFTPEEAAGGSQFPMIGETAYTITLGRYDYLWLLLKPPKAPSKVADTRTIHTLRLQAPWPSGLRDHALEQVERVVFPQYLARQRWFSAKLREIQRTKIIDSIPIGNGSAAAHFFVLEVRYSDGQLEKYALAVSFAPGVQIQELQQTPQAVIVSVETPQGTGVLFDSSYDPSFRARLLECFARSSRLRGLHGQLVFSPLHGSDRKRMLQLAQGASQVIKAEQSNTAMIYGNSAFLKLFRRVEDGLNPDVEVSRYLQQHTEFRHTPPFLSHIEYRRSDAEAASVGLLQDFVPNEGDAWDYALHWTATYFERVMVRKAEQEEVPSFPHSLFASIREPVPIAAQELIGVPYLEMIKLLGERTAQLHLALAVPTEDPDFSPEPFTMLYQRSLYHAMRVSCRRVLDMLRQKLRGADDALRAEIEPVLALEPTIIQRFARLISTKIHAVKSRTHGDYHLGQVIYTGNDFYISDFEGEPMRSIGERRLKRSPLRDVAGMLRSFQYPAYSVIFSNKAYSAQDRETLLPWADLRYRVVSASYLAAYLQAAGSNPVVPLKPEHAELLLECFLLEKVVYEVGYELNNRPDWVIVPLRGLVSLIRETGE